MTEQASLVYVLVVVQFHEKLLIQVSLYYENTVLILRKFCESLKLIHSVHSDSCRTRKEKSSLKK